MISKREERELSERFCRRDEIIRALTEEVRELKRFNASIENPSRFKLGDCVNINTKLSKQAFEGNPYKVIETEFFVTFPTSYNMRISWTSWKYTIINKHYYKIIVDDEYLTLCEEEKKEK